MTFFSLLSFVAFGQEISSHFCETDDGLYYQGYILDVPAIEEFSKQQDGGEQKIGQLLVPVRFTEFTNSNGAPFGYQSLTRPFNTYKATLFTYLKDIFGTGFSFYTCGNDNIISDDRFMSIYSIDNFLSEFSYSSGSADVFWDPRYSGANAPLPPPVYQELNPYSFPAPPKYDNTVAAGVSQTFSHLPHEFGHHFGLIHTFGVFEPSTGYTRPIPLDYIPIPPNSYPTTNPLGWPEPLTTNDYPYPEQIVSLTVSRSQEEDVYHNYIATNPSWRGRELVIRTYNSNKDFETPNFSVGGDLIEDTPPDTDPKNAWRFPGAPSSVQAITFNGCVPKPNFSFDYVDYNGDLVYPQSPNLPNIFRNVMGYWACTVTNQLLTPNQKTRASFYHSFYRNQQYGDQSLCGAFNGKVIDEKTGVGMNLVTIRTRHDSKSHTKSNVTTNLKGEFSGRLFSDKDVRAYVYYNGTQAGDAVVNGVVEPFFVLDPNGLASHFNYYPNGSISSDWLRDVDMLDVAAIHNHILQGGTNKNYLMNGFNIVGADVNHSNTITPTDMIEVQKLILGYISKFAAYDQPYRFMPEFVPESDITHFHANPFTMPLGQGSAYLNPGWSYDISSVGLNKRGFIASKLGDVDGPPPPNKYISVVKVGYNRQKGKENTNLRAGDDIELVVSTENFKNMDVFQFQVDFDAEYLKNIEISPLADLEDYTSEDNFNVLKEENGHISIRSVWLSDPQTLKNLEDGSSLFSIRASVVQDFEQLDDIIAIGGEQGIKSWVSHEVDLGKTNPELIVSLSSATKSRTNDQALTTLNTVQVFPNPFQDFIQISFEAEEEQIVLIELYNASGKLLVQEKKNAHHGQNNFTFDSFNQLEDGLYQVKIQVNDESIVKPVLKSKK